MSSKPERKMPSPLWSVSFWPSCGSAATGAVNPLTDETLERWKEGKIKVLGQNCWNSISEGGACRNKRPERLQAFCEYVEREGYDVLAVQEQFVIGLGFLCAKKDADDWSRALQKLGFVHQTSPAKTGRWIGSGSGIVIYSKLPILKQENKPQTQRKFEDKGWIAAVLGLPETCPQRRLIVASVHLESATDPKGTRIRKTQYQRLAKHISVLSADGTPVVVTGDFNVCSDEFGKVKDSNAEYDAMQEAFAAVGLSKDLAKGSALPSVREEFIEDAPKEGITRQTLDHAYVSSALSEQSAASVVDTKGSNGQIVSDHRGVHIEVKLSGKK